MRSTTKKIDDFLEDPEEVNIAPLIISRVNTDVVTKF